MRMLFIWLLVFSTFVGVGCDSVGAPPKWLSQADFATSHFGLSQADFATSHSWLSQADFAIVYSGPSLTDYTTSFLAYHGREQFIRRRGLSFGCQCHGRIRPRECQNWLKRPAQPWAKTNAYNPRHQCTLYPWWAATPRKDGSRRN